LTDPVARLNEALQGRYRIERELGEGGMATVYLADDLRHGRQVALKVLKPELAAVVGADRFLAEIKTTANLHHPHILPLFDSGEAGTFLFYVMPYVEGETLRSRIDRQRQLPVDEAVAIARAVAQALQHAHDRGVIHRDIKPANILMQDGQPVVSDFGIALAVGAAGGARLTETGLSVGTPYYMSPEQATGDVAVGPASDLYSLACVLYEMLTGDPPYIGSTAQAVLGKILQGAPVSATGVRKAVPANVDAAIRKALEKLPADRFEGAKDFAAALVNPSFRHAEGAADAWSTASPWNRLSVGASAAAVLFAVAFGWSVARTVVPESSETRSLRRFQIEIGPTQPISIAGIHAYLRLSPDGTSLVYSVATTEDGVPRLHFRRLDQLEARVLPGTENAYAPFFSPDGTWVGFYVPIERRLRKVSVQGGQPLDVIEAFPPLGGAWLDDGTIVYATQDNATPTLSGEGASLWRVSDAGGTPARLTTAVPGTAEAYHGFPDALPGGGGVVFTVMGVGGETAHVEALSLESGERTPLVDVGYDARYAATGHIVFARQGALWAKRFDPTRLQASGQEVVALQALEVGAFGVPFTFSADGLLVYMPGTAGVVVGGAGEPRRLVWVDRDGREEPLPLPTRGYEGPELSPDGGRVAVTVWDGPRADLWVYDVRSGASLRLTYDGSEQFRVPIWSPDGERIYYRGVDPTSRAIDLFWIPSDGSGEPQQLLATSEIESTTSISPDGETLVFRRQLADGGTAMVTMQLNGEPAEASLMQAPVTLGNASISPDGRSIAYFSEESGQREVYLQPYPGPGGKTPVSIGGGVEVRWSAAGNELFYRLGEAMMAASVEMGPGGTVNVGTPRVLFQGSYRNGNAFAGAREYDVAPDGRFLMIRQAIQDPDTDPDDYDHLVVVDNWLDELRRLLPVE